jgi:hypothetical protein
MILLDIPIMPASERITIDAQRARGNHKNRKSHRSAALPQTRRRVAPGETGFRYSSQTASLSHRSLLRGAVSSDGERLARRVAACPPEPSQEWPVSWRQPVRGIAFCSSSFSFSIGCQSQHWMSEPNDAFGRTLRHQVTVRSALRASHGRRSSLRLKPRNIRRRLHATRRS